MARLLQGLLAGACLTAGVMGQVIKRQQGSLPPVTSEGNAFWADGERFYVRGVAYQPGGAADAADPLLDMQGLTRDIQRVSIVSAFA
jgi:1,3-beta-glucanosyltransferase GAS5